MTTTPIRWKELSARERDDVISEFIFGISMIRCPFVPAKVKNSDTLAADAVDVFKRAYPMANPHGSMRYSTDISAAFQVVEKMRERGFAFTLESPNPVLSSPQAWLWVATFRDACKYGETAPEAICLAALTAIGLTIERE